MLHGRLIRVLPVVLRLSALGLRSVLVFLLARYLTPNEVGQYGLLAVMVAYAIYPLGFDFYTFSTREVLRHEKGSWSTFLRSQAAFTLGLYAILCPMMLLLFVHGLLPWSMMIWFYLLVPLEHLGIELDRILIAMVDHVGASIGLFLRQALVPTIVVPVLAFVPQMRHLETVLVAWVLFNMVGVVAGLLFVRRRLAGATQGVVDWKWILHGIRISFPFLMGTLCLRALFTVDRQVVQIVEDLETLAAYTLFMAIGNGMTSVIYAGVHQFTYPRLVKAVHDRDLPHYKSLLRSMTVRTLFVAAAIAALAIVMLPLLLRFVGHATYQEHAWMLPWVMLIVALYNMSLIPHFALYALDADRSILWLTVASLIGFGVTVAAALSTAAIPAVLAGILVASSVLLVGKGFAAHVRLQKVLRSWGHQ